jgi:hypothetical protein
LNERNIKGINNKSKIFLQRPLKDGSCKDGNLLEEGYRLLLQAVIAGGVFSSRQPQAFGLRFISNARPEGRDCRFFFRSAPL